MGPEAACGQRPRIEQGPFRPRPWCRDRPAASCRVSSRPGPSAPRILPARRTDLSNLLSTRTLGRVGIAGASLCGAAIVLMHLVQPALNPVDVAVSYYMNGRLGQVLGVGLVALGIGSLCLAAGLRATPGGTRMSAGFWLLLVWGAGCIVGGIFPPDPLRPVEPAAVRARPGPWDVGSARVPRVLAGSVAALQAPRGPGHKRRAAPSTGEARGPLQPCPSRVLRLPRAGVRRWTAVRARTRRAPAPRAQPGLDSGGELDG